jgi:hypothetical protein
MTSVVLKPPTEARRRQQDPCSTNSCTAIGLKALLRRSRHYLYRALDAPPPPRRPRCYLYRAQGTSLPATLALSYTPLYNWASPYVYKRGCPGPHGGGEWGRKRGEKQTNIWAHERTAGETSRRTTKGREKTSRGRTLPLSHPRSLLLALSRPRSLVRLVTPTTSTLVQDNTRLIPPLVFHLAPTHLGRDTQRQIYSSV